MGALRWYANSNKRQNSEKEVCLGFFKCGFLCSWLHECQFLKLSAVKGVFMQHTFSTNHSCPSWYFSAPSEPHAEVLAALEAIWAITAVLSLSRVCQLKHGQVHMTDTFLCVDGAQLVGAALHPPLIYCP